MHSRFISSGLVLFLALGACAASGDGKQPSADAAVAPATGGSSGAVDASVAASGGSGGGSGGGGGTGGSSGAEPASVDAAATVTDGPSPAVDLPGAAGDTSVAGGKVLIFSRTTEYRHASIEAAVARLSASLTERGFTTEATENAAVFTTAGGLSRFAAVILVSTTGKALGDPGTVELAALEAFVAGGGALVGLHSASSTEYPPSGPLTRLLGGRFVSHPGEFRTASCHREGNHPASSALPEPFVVRDEIYLMDNLRADNQVILRCDADSGPGRLPIAWYRQEGSAGRIFYTALGHAAEEWQPTKPTFRDHIFPGVLWALGR